MKTLIQDINKLLPPERIRAEEPMARHTSFRVGGAAALFVTAYTEEELSSLLRLLHLHGTEHLLIGNGSNLLVRDEGYPGVIVKLGGAFEEIAAEDGILEVGSAKLLSGAAAFACENALAGMEFASGIPGSIGGALFMNAGAYGGEMKDIVESVRLMRPDGSAVRTCSGEEMGFSYRHSALQESGEIALSARLCLAAGECEEIAEKMRLLNEKRNSKQPVNYPSAGSTFKRPQGGYAAALIEEAGLKGVAVGGAEVSEKHSGFIINKGGATCDDILQLMQLVRERVRERSGIELEPEVRIIGGTRE